MSSRNTLIGILALIGIIFLGNTTVDKANINNLEEQGQKNTIQKTTRPLQETRTAENPISSEAILVPKEVSTLQKPSLIDTLLNRKLVFSPIPDPKILPEDLRNTILSAFSVFGITETLSPSQVRFGGPAVIQRLREGAVALLSPKTLGAYADSIDGNSGVGGNLFSQEAWTGPFTETSCGVGFYEVVEVGGTEYCDVIRYDFYTTNPEDPDELNKSIAIALSVTDEQYCNDSCTQPSCKAVCEAVGADPATAYLYDDGSGTCGCGQPVYTSTCVNDTCVQVSGGDGQSTCATDKDCAQTFRGCLGTACVLLRGTAGIAGIAQCDTDLECLPDQERFTHKTCLYDQCVQVPGPGIDECDAPWALPCKKQCIRELVDILDAEGNPTGEKKDICERQAVKYTCLNEDNLQYALEPDLQDVLWSEVAPWGEPVGPQCALVRCLDSNGDGEITFNFNTDDKPDECSDSCLSEDGTPNDRRCGLPYQGPNSLSSTKPLVDFPNPITGSELKPPPLPDLSAPGGVGTGTEPVATCADLSGGGLDPATGKQIPDGIWDSCVIGAESNIACAPANGANDCLRLVHSQCAGQQCISVPGPGINQCGDPSNGAWDPITEAETACSGGTCSTGIVESPPTFDPANLVGGYYVLPSSSLYNRKIGDACSRGNKMLIDVIYTVAKAWSSTTGGKINTRDLNENYAVCGVDHATHNRGIDVDITTTTGATNVSASNKQPAVNLAKLFVDTGQVCGILWGESGGASARAVANEINSYFSSQCSYTPWRGTFMRLIEGHTGHMHVRVRAPDGSC